MMNIIRTKLGRNDPCWCGSGKKYKKCHLDQDKLNTNENHSSEAGNVTQHLLSPGLVTTMQPVPGNMKCPAYAATGEGEYDCSGYSRLTEPELDQMRKTCQAARRVLDKAIRAVRPGITTNDIDAIVHEACIDEGGYPSPRNYHGFPKSVCTSVNDQYGNMATQVVE